MNAPEACWPERLVFTREKDVLPAKKLARNDGADGDGADRHDINMVDAAAYVKRSTGFNVLKAMFQSFLTKANAR
jgi:hypothetical protein